MLYLMSLRLQTIRQFLYLIYSTRINSIFSVCLCNKFISNFHDSCVYKMLLKKITHNGKSHCLFKHCWDRINHYDFSLYAQTKFRFTDAIIMFHSYFQQGFTQSNFSYLFFESCHWVVKLFKLERRRWIQLKIIQNFDRSQFNSFFSSNTYYIFSTNGSSFIFR